MSFRVHFEDKWRSTSVGLASEPLLVPPQLRVVSRTPQEMVVGPSAATDDSADVLAGLVPLAHLDEGVVRLAWLEIPPPAPLSLDNLKEMWDQVAVAGLPLPSSAPGQARLPSGALTPHKQLFLDHLELAHIRARSMLASWPKDRATYLRWQHLELPGGREDPRHTAVHAAAHQGITTARGTVPVVSARRVGAQPAWSAQALFRASSRVVDMLARAKWLGDDTVRQTIVRPFVEVARASSRAVHRSDPPLSSWPTPARNLHEALLALSAIASVSDEDRPTGAPLCYVWRLYEAWIASEVLLGIDLRPDTQRTELVTAASGAEWVGRWDAPGGHVVACAQLRVAAEEVDLDERLIHGVRSLTSTLIPDVAVFRVWDQEQRMVVVDAKRRSAESMRPEEVAEAASKYLWGLRVTRSEASQNAPAADRVLIATTARTPHMYSDDSRIEATTVVPGGESDLVGRVSLALELPG